MIVSADTDFGTLIILRKVTRPSVILFRRGAPRRPTEQAAALLANVPSVVDGLAQGAIVVFSRDRLRIRPLR